MVKRHYCGFCTKRDDEVLVIIDCYGQTICDACIDGIKTLIDGYREENPGAVEYLSWMQQLKSEQCAY